MLLWLGFRASWRSGEYIFMKSQTPAGDAASKKRWECRCGSSPGRFRDREIFSAPRQKLRFFQNQFEPILKPPGLEREQQFHGFRG